MLNFDTIQYKTTAQKRFYDTISKKDITFCIGPAGCGKTYLSVHKALRELGDKDNRINGIVIVKPLVEAAGEKLGFLPGDIEEKTAPWMMSFYQKTIIEDINACARILFTGAPMIATR